MSEAFDFEAAMGLPFVDPLVSGAVERYAHDLTRVTMHGTLADSGAVGDALSEVLALPDNLMPGTLAYFAAHPYSAVRKSTAGVAIHYLERSEDPSAALGQIEDTLWELAEDPDYTIAATMAGMALTYVGQASSPDDFVKRRALMDEAGFLPEED